MEQAVRFEWRQEMRDLLPVVEDVRVLEEVMYSWPKVCAEDEGHAVSVIPRCDALPDGRGALAANVHRVVGGAQEEVCDVVEGTPDVDAVAISAKSEHLDVPQRVPRRLAERVGAHGVVTGWLSVEYDVVVGEVHKHRAFDVSVVDAHQLQRLRSHHVPHLPSIQVPRDVAVAKQPDVTQAPAGVPDASVEPRVGRDVVVLPVLQIVLGRVPWRVRLRLRALA